MVIKDLTTKEKKDVQTSKRQELDTTSNATTRDIWQNQCEFFLSCLGYAVGTGNLWRFPYLCFKNGGAIFLIPYTTMLLCAGIPMFFMEAAIGQYVSLGPNILFEKLLPIASGLGWAMVVLSAFYSLYFNMIFAWSLFYFFGSFTSVLPWSHCNNSFNTVECTSDIDARNCREVNQVYFNRSCHQVEFMCTRFNQSAFNSTHCAQTERITTYQSVENVIGRHSASEDYFMNGMLRVSNTTWENMGEMNWALAGYLALSWICIFLCMFKGIKSSGKVAYFTALFPYVVLVILVVRGITLEGSEIGIRYYFLDADWDYLWRIEVWNDAATQIFFSLGVSFGGIITLSSYNKFKTNCMRDAIIIAIANCLTSVFAGFAIFSILGFMAKQMEVPIQEVVRSGAGLAFIAYPEAIAKMPFPTIWALLFFAMLMMLGIDSLFASTEVVSTAILDQFEFLRPKKTLVMALLCFLLFLGGLTMCLNGGIYMFELFNSYSCGISVLIVAMLEVMIIQYVYGFDKFMDNIRTGMGIYVPLPLYYYWKITWQFLTPLSICVILLFSVYSYSPAGFGDYIFPSNVQTLGWILCASSVVLIPLFAIFRICKSIAKGESLEILYKTTEDYCPAHERKRRQMEVSGLKEEPVRTV